VRLVVGILRKGKEVVLVAERWKIIIILCKINNNFCKLCMLFAKNIILQINKNKQHDNSQIRLKAS
jgi:hypothetical protein